MALESVDLLSLLKRARKSPSTGAENGTPAVVESAPASSLTGKSAPAEAAAVPAAAAGSVVKPQEAEELAALRAELYSDEVLLQRILGLLYRRKKENPNSGFISILDMERILHIEREGATFVMSYMKTQKVIEMDDKSRMAITVPGIDYLRGVLGLGNGSTPAAEPVNPE